MFYEFPKRAPLPLRVELDHGASGYKVSALTTWSSCLQWITMTSGHALK